MKLTKNDLVGIPHSTLSKNKAGNYVIRKGYFYKMGMSAEIIAEKLKEKFPDVEIVNTWDILKPFRGGATTANSSHFGVEFRFIKK